MRLEAEHPETIHLLLTDVVMPGMNGPTLADRLMAKRPALKRIFMSGHPTDAIGRYGTAEGEMEFLAKPFTYDQLASKVNEVLSRRSASVTGDR